MTGVLFALGREAGPFRRLVRGRTDVVVRVSGVGPTAARAAAQKLIDEVRPDRVIAAGFCGALDPALAVGDIVVSPRILTVGHVAATPAEKAALRAVSGADAVDMESAAVEAVCRDRGVGFVGIRAVSDAANSSLSPELVRLLSGGEVAVSRALTAMARRPTLLREFLRLGRDTARAARALARALHSECTGEPGASAPEFAAHARRESGG